MFLYFLDTWKLSFKFTFVCHEHYFDAYWNKEQFAANTSYRVQLLDKRCNAFSSNITHIWIRSYFSRCATEVRESNHHIVFSNLATVTAVYFNNGIIKKEEHFPYKIDCLQKRHINVSSQNTYNVSKMNERDLERGIGYLDLDLTMKIYDNQLFSQVASDPVAVSHGQPLYVEIRERKNNQNFHFVVTKCFASPSQTRQEVFYTFFYRKCPTDSSFRRIRSSADVFQFKISAFEFILSNFQVVISCDILLCPANVTTGDCMQDCKRRRAQRDVLSDGETPIRSTYVTTQTLTYKPKILCDSVTCPEKSR